MSSPFEAEQIVAAAYRSLLLREPDVSGLNFWSASLRQHGSIEQLIAGFVGSAEFRKQLPLFLARHQPSAAVSVEGRGAGTIGSWYYDPETIHAFILSHTAWRGTDVLARTGDPVDMLRSPRVYRCSNEMHRAELRSLGVQVTGVAPDTETIVIFDETAAPVSVEVHTQGWTDNVLIFGPDCLVQGSFTFGGAGNLAYCGGLANQPQIYRAALYTHASAFVFGAESTSVGADFHIEGPGRHVVVGRGCMFSAEVYVAGTDNHAVYEEATGEVLNMPEDVAIGPRSWVGFGATVLKGAHVGEGAIVAARAVLTRPAEAKTLVAGSPARVLRTGVTWSRAFPSVLQEERRALIPPG